KGALMKKMVAMVAVLALVSGACGGGDDRDERADTVDDTAQGDTERDQNDDQAAGDVDVEQALLALEDMPTGWTTSPDAGEEDEGAAEFCAGLDITDDEADADAEASFQGSEMGPFVSHAVARFDGGGDTRFAQLRKAIDGCGDFDITDEEGNTLTGRLSAVSFPEFGEESLAVRLSGTVTTVADPDFGELEFPMAADLIFFRRGDALAGLFHLAIDTSAFGGGGGGLDSTITEDLARKAEEKLAAVA
ncbi:MAG TPA: hypothetical protein VGR26_17455, partial [Acidimicrobiales bacterium]|nr:hypothetical protein [Acidimicrobiales bacterium]